MALRDSELFIEMPEPDRAPCDPILPQTIKPLPGRVVVQMDPPRQRYGSLCLPDEVKGRTRPDSGTVVAVGPPKRLQSGNHGPVELMIGDRVLVRPYHGLWLDDFLAADGWCYHDLRLYGVTHHWSESIVAVWAGDAWRPSLGWLLVRREPNHRSSGGIHLPRAGRLPKANRARVLATSNGGHIPPDSWVLCDPDPNAGLQLRFGDLPGCEFISEISEDGMRQVWAVMDDN